MKKLPLIVFAVLCIIIGMLVTSIVYYSGWEKGRHFGNAGKIDINHPSIKQAINLQNSFRLIAKSAIPAVVNISTEVVISRYGSPFGGRDLFEEFFGEDFYRFFFNEPKKQRKKRNLGSGVIISEDGFILTNVHVIKNASKIIVSLSDNKDYTATISGVDPKTDLALIKIKASNPLPFLPMGDSDKIEVGDWSIAIGNPFGLNQTFTVGVISAKGRTDIGVNIYENFIQTDASINPGNSGGPLLSISGEVIGINTAIATPSGGSVGIGFAVPINMAKNILPQLKEKGMVVRGYLGVRIRDLTEDLAKPLGIKPKSGILVEEVSKGSPAVKGGIKTGDIIIYFNNTRVKTASQLQRIVGDTKIGSTVPIVVLRNKKKINLRIRIVENTL